MPYSFSVTSLLDLCLPLTLIGQLLSEKINASSSEDGLNFYDSGHRFEHSQLLLVLLHSLPFAPRPLQSRALQVG
ncbi:unnamed protein product [Sphenostylis stenocarpa]|uniref:Secreted protein n=1 Tax=Sphenostylis stenocarpa TaxID=92480 RepID=A0AA86SZZ7_9FABA|nr:unnamed protein product [Sphenostylis stenocarpa]